MTLATLVASTSAPAPTLPDPACPVCSGERFEPFAPVQPAYRRSIVGAWDAGEEFWLSSCLGCRHLAIRPVPSPGFVDAFYRGYMSAGRRGFYRSHFEGEREDSPHVVRARRRAIALRRRSGGGHLLDVGCGPGVFLREARHVGFDVAGVEPHAEAAQVAHDRTGARMCVATMERADWPEASFDVVTLWDVIEHLRDPGEALERAARWVRPGGWLGLETPDAGSLLHRLARAMYRSSRGRLTRPMAIYDVHHLHYFDGERLRRLLSAHGFIVEGGWRESTLLAQYEDRPHGRAVHLGIQAVFLLAELLGWQNKQVVFARRR